ncbi:MAG: sulfatase-like hydrolase/transferase, partial [Bythopirellula sp.]
MATSSLRAVRFVTASVAISIALGGHSGAFGQGSSKPNIVLIMADDLGYETMAAYGGAEYSTPNI